MITMLIRIIICVAIASSIATGTAGALIAVTLFFTTLGVELAIRNGRKPKAKHNGLNTINVFTYVVERINYSLSRIIKKKVH